MYLLSFVGLLLVTIFQDFVADEEFLDFVGREVFRRSKPLDRNGEAEVLF